MADMNISHTDFTNISANDLIVFNGTSTTSTGVNVVAFKDISAPRVTLLEI